MGKQKRRRVKPRDDQERFEFSCAWEVYATFWRPA
jgi:hypothetical protein